MKEAKQDFHIDAIKCPECGYEQFVKVIHTWPWPFVHECVKCNYVIMESEWDKINTNQ